MKKFSSAPVIDGPEVAEVPVQGVGGAIVRALDLSETEIKPLLRSYEDVARIYEKNEKPEPYVIKRAKGSQELIFLGLKHSSDVSDPQYSTVQEEWSEFIVANEGKNKLVLVESRDRSLAASPEEAIETCGETGLMVFLANQEGVEVLTPEPTIAEEGEYLAREFSQESVMLHHFVRQIPQWYRTDNPQSFEDYMKDVLANYKVQLGWDFNFTYQNMVKLYRNEFGEELDPAETKKHSQLVEPAIEGAITNMISMESGKFRDIYIAKQIANHWVEGRSLFITYGSGHAFTLEPFLDTL